LHQQLGFSPTAALVKTPMPQLQNEAEKYGKNYEINSNLLLNGTCLMPRISRNKLRQAAGKHQRFCRCQPTAAARGGLADWIQHSISD